MTYFHVSMVRTALNSILQQDYEDYEVLVADNASTDGTVEILKEYAGQDSRFRLFLFSENLGCNARYDPMLREARGKYILTLSGDDWFSPGIFRAAVEAAERHAADLVHFGFAFNYFDNVGNPVRENVRIVDRPIVAQSSAELAEQLEDITTKLHMEGECGLLRRVAFLKENNIWMENHWEDGPYVADLFAACQRYVAIPVRGYEYRAYLSEEQAMARNSSSNSYYVRPRYIETMPYTAATYLGMCKKAGMPDSFLRDKYAEGLCWVLGAYLSKAGAKRDIYFRGSPISETERLEILEKVLSEKILSEIIPDPYWQLELFCAVMGTVQTVFSNETLTERSDLAGHLDWLLELYFVLERLRKTDSYHFREDIEAMTAAVSHPKNVLGLGKAFCTLVQSILCKNWEKPPFLSQLEPLRKKGQSPAIYGAGKNGRILLRLLAMLGLAPVCFIDQAVTGTIEGTPVMPLDEFAKSKDAGAPVLISVYEERIRAQIEENCRQKQLQICPLKVSGGFYGFLSYLCGFETFFKVLSDETVLL